MRAGKLSHQIIIERETQTITAAGHVRKAWTQIASVRAEIKQASATEFLTGFGEADAGNVVFRVRWIPGVEITTADRIRHGGKVYNLKGIVEIGRRLGLELRGVAQ